MIAELEALKFGLYIAFVGIGVTFGSLVFLYLILAGFARYERWALKRHNENISSEEPLSEEEVASAVIGIERYLEEERERIPAPLEFKLEFRRPSAWKLSGRSED